MYDSLNRKYLSPYGNTKVHTPNFDRLAQKGIRFDNFYAGSLPCMPARRELHTGRYNFLHRSWGPLEPFDDSAFEILSDNGIYTHMITDHAHYWQEGGLTYHNRFSSYEFIRGQEGDFSIGDSLGYDGRLNLKRQDQINRAHRKSEDDYPHVICCNKALSFLRENVNNDNWHLHLEYFDPHEPFDVPKRFLEQFGLDSINPNDWPPYSSVDDPKLIEIYRKHYCAIISMCDEYLGKILDFMDENNMWEDTLLIVNTDHGFMLGEHGFFAKNYMPNYEEISHTPFFMCIPGSEKNGTSEKKLSQTIDIAPTLLDYYGLQIPQTMRGISLFKERNADDERFILFGEYGKHVCITDGEYVYMRAGRNECLNEYTIMPTHIFTPFSVNELRKTEKNLCTDFSFTKGIPVMKIPATSSEAPNNSCYWYDKHMAYGDLLFNICDDPEQISPLKDPEKEKFMIKHLISEMKKDECPKEQFIRLGLEEEMD